MRIINFSQTSLLNTFETKKNLIKLSTNIYELLGLQTFIPQF